MRNFNMAFIAIFLASLSWMSFPAYSGAQTSGRMGAVLRLTGASSEEELDEQELERFSHYLSHPLRINSASRSRLLSSGLLSQYQVASLLDYISREGDVLSYSELAAVEGFGSEYTAALRPFISLESASPPGQAAEDSLRVRQDALARVALKGGNVNYGAKYKISVGERGEASLAARTTYQDEKQFPPSSMSANVTLYGKRLLGKVVAGDYNLRVGQGLSLWSGLSLTSLSSSSSFSRRPTGLSPSWSWSGIGSHRGVAADFQAGRFSFIAFLSLPGLRGLMEGSDKEVVMMMPGGVLGWSGRSAQLSLSAWRSSAGGKVSGDYRLNILGTDIFGETALDIYSGSVATVDGVSVYLGEGWRFNAVGRIYPAAYDGSFSGGVRSWTKTSDERGVAVGIEKYGAQLTADFASKDADRSRKQLKLFLKIPFQCGEKAIFSARVTERVRPYEEYLKYRTGARLDLDWSSAGISARYGESDGDTWKGRFRIESLLCRSLSGLTYIEGGRKTGRWNCYLRGTLFIVDNWDDRIYSYERDAPGNFTVPAYYGRGYSLSAVGGARFTIKKKNALKTYFRASLVSYPFMKSPKPSTAEAKLQAVLAF